MVRHYKRGRAYKLDRAKRSSEPWEFGRKAPKKGNPSFAPVFTIDKRGRVRKVYIRRKNLEKYLASGKYWR